MPASPSNVVKRLAEQEYEHLYIDGGKTIQGFISEGLIQKLIVTKVPILIGSGIPLFGALPHDIRLHHLETLQFDNGLVQSKSEILEKTYSNYPGQLPNIFLPVKDYVAREGCGSKQIPVGALYRSHNSCPWTA
ncbi:unnamed protein product, partial [marine sediment metagenome]